METDLRSLILKYLNDDLYYQAKSKEIVYRRRYKNYYCLRHDGKRIPLKEIGDLFGMFEGLNSDHTNKLLPQLLDMNIPVYAKRNYDSVEDEYRWAIDKNLLVYET